mmetsp:Transcript_27285/g.33451  ORF Transcript_27285/g.33451 Transcript_27285/m.33451 type:complete len:87 (+) Transcript_27285:565-825(+)
MTHRIHLPDKDKHSFRDISVSNGSGKRGANEMSSMPCRGVLEIWRIAGGVNEKLTFLRRLECDGVRHSLTESLMLSDFLIRWLMAV